MDGSSLSSPYTLIRLNPRPFRLLSAAGSAEFADAFTDLDDAEGRAARRSAELMAIAERRIATLPESSDERAELIRIRRRIRTGKIREEIFRIDLVAGIALFDAISDRDRAVRRIQDHEAAAADGERRELVRWASDSDVQRATAMTSTAFSASVIRLAERASFDKASRRSLPALVRYHSRSIARVSPFARYTAVGAVFSGGSPSGAELSLRSVVKTSRLVYRLLFRVLCLDGVARRRLPWQVSELIEQRQDQMLVHTRHARGAFSARFEGAVERTLSIPSASPWAALINALNNQLPRPTTLDDIVAYIAATSETSLERATAVAGRLAELGAIVPVLPVSEHSADFDEEWTQFLRRTLGEDHALTKLHEDTERTRREFPTLAGCARVEALEGLHRRWGDAVQDVNGSERITNDLYLEDCYVSGPLDGFNDARAVWEEDIRLLFPLLRATDNHDIFAAVVDNAFVDRFGAEGRCENLIEFSEVVAARIEETIRGTSSSPNIRVFEKELDPLARHYRAAARNLLQDWVSRPAAEFAIPQGDIDSLRPEGPKIRRRSTLAVHGQPDGDRLIVNHFYGGPGVYLSRFTPALSADERREFERYVASANSVDQLMQLRPVFGFNANLAPELADTVLLTPNEPNAGTAEPRTIADLEARRENGEIRLRDLVSGRDTELRYFGFLVPFVLPSLERMLTAYWGGPAIALDFLDEVLGRRLTNTVEDTVAAPRLRFRSLVIARRRWALHTRTLLDRLSVDGESAFIELNRWRRRRGIPPQVFLKPLGGVGSPVEEVRPPKPTLLDFASVLHVATLRKVLERFPSSVVLEELDPRPETSGLATTAGRHALELYFEAPYENET